MIILTIRTDKPEAEICLYDGLQKIAEESWKAHRQLADTIHVRIRELTERQKLSLHGMQGIVIFKGPGSFTGLRIGTAVANALADSLGIPIIAAGGTGWLEKGINKLLSGQNDKVVLPDYGAPPKTTAPRK